MLRILHALCALSAAAHVATGHDDAVAFGYHADGAFLANVIVFSFSFNCLSIVFFRVF